MKVTDLGTLLAEDPPVAPRLLAPPRAFISYRHNESDALMQWVVEFAAHLARRKVHVVFDQFLPPSRDAERRHPSEIVQRVQGCHVFIPVFTPGYLARIQSAQLWPQTIDDGWAFDEWQLSLALGSRQLIETIGVLRAGEFTNLPAPFDAANTIDCRSTYDYARKLNELAYYMRFDRAVVDACPDLGPTLDRYSER
jgi:hypothetical protein